ncbi:hypothetical protein QYE76_027661 [Lolium multiflorum]|uniref:Isopenicillin N synthase-like Fe(2+) 2OG dioxygenase domain-containing protein n=1 Tax=Lolium multiflorum TaxID=4521 RepID=A0AAD8QN25_LOLMU|nr:hypothetical protein QYE76_027661 [Lolium multiflorum]
MLPSLGIKEVPGNIGVDIIGGTILAIRPLAMSRNPLRLRKDILFRSRRRHFHTKLCHDALLTASGFLLCHIGVIHTLLNIELEAEGLLYLDLELGVLMACNSHVRWEPQEEGMMRTAASFPSERNQGLSNQEEPRSTFKDSVGGLRVLVEDEKLQLVWVDVPAVAGVFIVNIGDFLQLMSNHKFKSVEYRVVAKSIGRRISVACFFQLAAYTRVYGPIIPEGDLSPPLYRSTTTEELLRRFMDKGLDGTSVLHHFRL